MKHVEIEKTAAGRWLYRVWIAGRIVIIGECATRARAESEAASV